MSVEQVRNAAGTLLLESDFGEPLHASAQSLSYEQQAQAQENIGVGSVFALIGHQNNTILNRLRAGVSFDGKTFKSVGTDHPWAPALGGVRDPSMFFYEPTGEWIISYTRGGAAATYETTNGAYDETIGLCKTRDFETFTELTSITIGGTSPAHDYVWNGSFFLDDGNYYLLVLPLPDDGDKEDYSVGWIRCTNPGTWTEWTDFVSLKATNAAWSTATNLNDVKILKLADDTYRLFLDGTLSGTHGILTATSSSPLTGYSALTAVSGHANREGAIVSRKPGGGYRLYSETVFGPMQYSDTDDDFVTMGAKTDIGWREAQFIGNGDVLEITTLEAQVSLLAARQVDLVTIDGSPQVQGRTLISFSQWAVYVGSLPTGNGTEGTPGTSIWVAGPGGLNANVPIYAVAGLTVYSSLAFSDAGTLAATRVNLGLGVPSTPASAGAAGVAGTVAWDASYIYVCTATNTWKRAAIASW